MDTRIERKLNATKAHRTKVTRNQGFNSKEGEQGEFRINNDGKGNTLNIKMGNGWKTIATKNSSYWIGQFIAGWKTRYNHWHFTESSYGAGYHYWDHTFGSSSLPTSWADSTTPPITAPIDCIIRSYNWRGRIDTESNTLELALLRGAPTYNTAGDTSLNLLNDVVSHDVVYDIMNQMGSENLSNPLKRGDIIIPALRRTTNNNSNTRNTYGTFTIVAEIIE